MTERILDPVIGAGKFVGEALLILGIAMGLATMIANLSFQSRSLPALTRRAIGTGEAGGAYGPARPIVPDALVKLGIAGAVIMVVALPLAFVRAGFIGWALNRQFDGLVSPLALRVEGILGRTIDPLINLGLGMLFFTIAFRCWPSCVGCGNSARASGWPLPISPMVRFPGLQWKRHCGHSDS